MSEPALQPQIDAANVYEKLFVPALFRQWATVIADAAQIQPGHCVLDVACGTGILARELKSRVGSNGRVVGLEPNPGMLAVAEDLDRTIDWHHGVAESLPFADQTFDAVLSQFGIMFFSHRTKALLEMFRVLVPSGNLVVAVWDSLPNNPAYARAVELLQKHAGTPAADALRAPFALGDRQKLSTLFSEAAIRNAKITKHSGTGNFPNIRTMIEVELRGWLPLMGVILDEDQIALILEQAEHALHPYVTSDGTVSFPVSVQLVSATKA